MRGLIFVLQVASQLDNLQSLLGVVLKVLLHALGRNQSTCVLQNMFATQRSLVFKVDISVENYFHLYETYE
jgi:hypothetical protein